MINRSRDHDITLFNNEELISANCLGWELLRLNTYRGAC